MINKTEAEIMALWGGDLAKPLVSICAITYNHKNFIGAALDSFLMQETDFPFEILVGEDRSTDGTREIVEEYQSKYPSIIKIVSGEFNVGADANWLRTIDSAKGKYIAYCDGDDYYLAADKISKAVDHLQSDPGLCFLFTSAKQIYENSDKSKIRNRYTPDEIDRINLNWVLKKGGAFYPTSTIVFLRSLGQNRPDWFYKHTTGDYPLAIMAILAGKIGYLDDVSACYRIHTSSMTNCVWEDKSKQRKVFKRNYDKNINFIEVLKSEGVVDEKMFRFLIAKEDYVYFAKLLNLGYVLESLKALYKVRYSNKYRLRIIAKLIYKVILRK